MSKSYEEMSVQELRDQLMSPSWLEREIAMEEIMSRKRAFEERMQLATAESYKAEQSLRKLEELFAQGQNQRTNPPKLKTPNRAERRAAEKAARRRRG